MTIPTSGATNCSRPFVHQLRELRNVLAISVRATRLTSDETELELGKRRIQDDSLHRTQVFDTRGERLLAVIDICFQETITSSALPALDDTLVGPVELLGQLQTPTVETAKSHISASKLDALLYSIFKPGNA